MFFLSEDWGVVCSDWRCFFLAKSAFAASVSADSAVAVDGSTAVFNRFASWYVAGSKKALFVSDLSVGTSGNLPIFSGGGNVTVLPWYVEGSKNPCVGDKVMFVADVGLSSLCVSSRVAAAAAAAVELCVSFVASPLEVD